MKPLTAEQSKIAELNHDLVFEFLNEYNLSESQYYYVVIFGYLCAAQEYCEKPQSNKFSFSTVAWKKMKQELYRYGKYLERKKRDFQTVSLSDIKDGYDSSLKTDETAAENRLLEDLNFSLLLHSLASAITEKQITLYLKLCVRKRMKTDARTFAGVNRKLPDKRGNLKMQNNLYSSVKLEWYEISHYIEKALAKVLKGKTVCCAAFEDAEYWSVRIMNRRLSVAELKTLLEFVKADDKTTEDSIPEDSDSAKFIGMRLSSMLLGIALGARWQECYATQNALWLIGINFDSTYKTDIESKLCLAGDTAVDSEKLLSEKEFRKLLYSNGGDYNALVVTAEQNRKNYADLFGTSENFV